MMFENRKRILASAWIVAVIAVALVASVGPMAAWLLISVVALGPAFVLLRLWKERSLTTSELIQNAQR